MRSALSQSRRARIRMERYMRSHDRRLVRACETDLEVTIGVQEEIRWLQVAMENIGRVEGLQSSQSLRRGNHKLTLRRWRGDMFTW